MLHLNPFVVFVYFVLYFKVIHITANSNTRDITSDITCEPAQQGSTLTQKASESTHDNLLDLRLTELLAIQLERRSEHLKSFISDICYKGFGNDDTIEIKQNSTPLSNDTSLLLLDNLANEVTHLRSSVELLKVAIESIKSSYHSNMTASFRVCDYEPATKLLSMKTPIGVNYNSKCKLDEDKAAYEKNYPKNCQEVQEQGNNKSGIYKIRPRASNKPFMVLCDLESRGGGWTHIQKRFDGSQDFFLNWRDYKFGFGDLDGEFWLGLEHIYLTIGFEVNELLVEITDRDNKQAYAHYKVFGIGSEADGYPLNSLSGFTGDAGDSLIQHLGMKFSTQDFDQDAHEGNCAQMFAGGWWYKGCHVSNLNGKFINAVLPKAYKYQGIHWLTYRGHEYCHSKVRMLVRPARHT